MLIDAIDLTFGSIFFWYKKQTLEFGLFSPGLRPKGGWYSFTEISAINLFNIGEEGEEGKHKAL